MATALRLLLQEPTLKSKDHLCHSPQSPVRHALGNFRVRIKRCKTVSIKCSLSNKNDSAHHHDTTKHRGFFVNMETKKSHFGFVANRIMNALMALKKPAAAAVLVGLLLMYKPNSALAAGSGGRMGGNSFSSHSSSTGDSASRPRSGVDSDFGFSYSVPYYNTPSPFGGVYVGSAVGVGSNAFPIVIAFVAFILVSGYLSKGSESSRVLTATEETSVLRLQVGLLGLGRSLQKDLNRIAETADTSTSEGLHYILTETVDVKRSVEGGEKRFNELSIEERGKFVEETLVNVNNIKKQSSMRLRASGFSNEYIVITILVAAGGEQKLPSINNTNDLKEALRKLASIPSSRTLAVEVLWTPQSEDDTLSERELLEDYPLLRPL